MSWDFWRREEPRRLERGVPHALKTTPEEPAKAEHVQEEQHDEERPHGPLLIDSFNGHSKAKSPEPLQKPTPIDMARTTLEASGMLVPKEAPLETMSPEQLQHETERLEFKLKAAFGQRNTVEFKQAEARLAAAKRLLPHDASPVSLAKSEPIGAPELVPVDQLHSREAVDAAYARESEYLRTTAKLLAPTDLHRRREHLEQLQYLQRNPLAINDGRLLLQKLHAQKADREKEELGFLRRELEHLGGKEMWSSSDSVETLRGRYQRLSAAHDARRREIEDNRLYMSGTDGYVGTAEKVVQYEHEQQLDALFPGTTTGSTFAGWAAMATHNNVDAMRRWGAAGNNAEEFAQAMAGIDLTKLGRSQVPDTRLRGHSRPAPPPGLGPRARSPLDTRVQRTTPSPTANTLPPAQLTEPTPARVERARYKGRAERFRSSSFDAPRLESMEEALENRTNATRKLDTLRNQGAEKKQINAARYHVITASRDVGEAGADAAVHHKFPGPPPPTKLYPPPGTPSRSGDFDQVWRVTVNGVEQRLIVEAKGGTSPKGTREVEPGVRAEQGSVRYFNEILSSMKEHKDPAARATAEELSTWNRDNVQYLHIQTPIKQVDGRSTAPVVKVREFDLRPENER